VGRDLLDLRFALRSQLSEEQWRRLFPPSSVPPPRWPQVAVSATDPARTIGLSA